MLKKIVPYFSKYKYFPFLAFFIHFSGSCLRSWATDYYVKNY